MNDEQTSPEEQQQQTDPATAIAHGESGPMAFAELSPDQKSFMADLQLQDFQQLLGAREQGHNCMNRRYIQGEALPMPDPEGATNTFLVLYCEVAYVRVFYGSNGIVGLSFNDFVDGSQPGMTAFRVELREKFQSQLPAFVKFCQTSINQFVADQTKPKIVTLDEVRKMRSKSKNSNGSEWNRGPKH